MLLLCAFFIHSFSGECEDEWQVRLPSYSKSAKGKTIECQVFAVLRSLILNNCRFSNLVPTCHMEVSDPEYGNYNVFQGAVTCFAPDLLIEGCTFEHIETQTVGAGVAFHGLRCTIKNTNFLDCIASSSAGAIIAKNGSEFTMTGCTIDGCTSDNTGGAGIVEFTTVTIASTTFFDCKDLDSAGCVWIERANTATITQCTFDDSISGDYTAGVKSTASDLTMDSCTFRHLVAAGSGAAVWADASTFKLTNSLIDDCSCSDESGGIKTTADTLTVEDCVFTNLMSGSCGAIWVDTANAVQVVGCIFDDCESILGAGGLYLMRVPDIEVRSCSFVNCPGRSTPVANGNEIAIIGFDPATTEITDVTKILITDTCFDSDSNLHALSKYHVGIILMNQHSCQVSITNSRFTGPEVEAFLLYDAGTASISTISGLTYNVDSCPGASGGSDDDQTKAKTSKGAVAAITILSILLAAACGVLVFIFVRQYLPQMKDRLLKSDSVTKYDAA